jgi:putative ABC transport system ATP-binding protein
MAEPLIITRELTKVYRMEEYAVTALSKVSIDIRQGEFVAVMGPSGSGKSTFMNLLGCLDSPSSGEYRLAGETVSSLTGDALAAIRNRRIGFVFQNFNLLPRTSAVENVELPMVYAGVPARERRERATAALARVGLGERIDHTPNQLSGGQQQRVAVARALVGAPRLILADEPTGNLDSANGEAIMDLLVQLNAEGTTIVMVTHSRSHAAYGQRIINMLDGRILTENVLVSRVELDHA